MGIARRLSEDVKRITADAERVRRLEDAAMAVWQAWSDATLGAKKKGAAQIMGDLRDALGIARER